MNLSKIGKQAATPYLMFSILILTISLTETRSHESDLYHDRKLCLRKDLAGKVGDGQKATVINGDGTLSVCSIRSNKVQAQSEFCEDEPLSVVIMKNGRKVICGTQTGTLLLYSWGFFKDCSDRFVDLSPNPVDALLKYDEDMVIAGSSNGIISLVGILPNRIIQPIAEHSEYPVERLAFSHDKKLLGSISHDNMLKLWDMDELLQGPSTVIGNNRAALDSDDSDNDGMDVDSDLANASKGTKRKNTGSGNGQASSSFGSFFEGL